LGAGHKALEERKSAELQIKAKHFLELFEGGGETVNGLKLKLKVDKQKLAPGENIVFTLVVCNLGGQPQELNAGDEYEGEFFKSAQCLRRLVTEGNTTVEKKPSLPRKKLGRRVPPYKVNVPAWSFLEFTVEAHVCAAEVGLHFLGSGLTHGFIVGKNQFVAAFKDLRSNQVEFSIEEPSQEKQP